MLDLKKETLIFQKDQHFALPHSIWHMLIYHVKQISFTKQPFQHPYMSFCMDWGSYTRWLAHFMIQTQALPIKTLLILSIMYPTCRCQEWSIMLKTSFNAPRYKGSGWKIKEAQELLKAILKELYLAKK